MIETKEVLIKKLEKRFLMYGIDLKTFQNTSLWEGDKENEIITVK